MSKANLHGIGGGTAAGEVDPGGRLHADVYVQVYLFPGIFLPTKRTGGEYFGQASAGLVATVVLLVSLACCVYA